VQFIPIIDETGIVENRIGGSLQVRKRVVGVENCILNNRTVVDHPAILI
jgi:hypothetical protein